MIWFARESKLMVSPLDHFSQVILLQANGLTIQQFTQLPRGEKSWLGATTKQTKHTKVQETTKWRVLSILSDGKRWRLRDILEKLKDRPAERTLRDDLQFLKKAGLVDSGGKSVAARWWLVVDR